MSCRWCDSCTSRSIRKWTALGGYDLSATADVINLVAAIYFSALTFVGVKLSVVKLKHQKIASISSCVLAIAVHTAVVRIPAVAVF